MEDLTADELTTEAVHFREQGDYLLQFFRYEQLPEGKRIGEPFWRLAHLIVERLPRNPERTVALRKLLEGRDCAVRAVLFNPFDPSCKPRM